MKETELKYYAPFEEGKFFHIYNRANSKKDLLFYKKDNYNYFLNKYNEYLSPHLDTFAYCLIPNHFHLMVKAKKLDDQKGQDVNGKIVEQFRRFFISFSQAINKQEGRRGSLFQKRFKRVAVKDSSHFTQLIFYIHFNPVHHKLIKDLRDYKWSSFKSILSKKRTKIIRNEILDWFGSRDNLKKFHENYQVEKVNRYLIIET